MTGVTLAFCRLVGSAFVSAFKAGSTFVSVFKLVRLWHFVQLRVRDYKQTLMKFLLYNYVVSAFALL